MKRAHLLALLCLHVLFYVLYFTPRLREDEPYYYEPLRSAFFDRDLNYYDERPFTRRLGPAPIKLFIAGPNAGGRPAGGGPNNSFDVGTTMLEVPFFLAGHGLARLASAAGSAVACHGYSAPYLHAMQLGFLAAGLGSVVMLYALCILEGIDPSSAFWATAIIVFGTFLPAYIYEDTLLSHLPSFASSTLFVWVLTRCRKAASAAVLFALGASYAWLVMTRRQNLLFGAMFLVLLPWILARQSRVRRFISTALVVSAGFLVFLSPELLVWKIAYGHFFENPGMAALRTIPVFGLVLLSDHGGLFSHSPVLIPAALGLLLLLGARRGGPTDRPPELLWGACLILGVLLQQLVNALRADWWPGIGFGNRRSDSCLPIFALGLGALLTWLGRRANAWPRRLLLGLLVCLGLWNMAFLPQFYSGERIAEKGNHFFSYASHRDPSEARIRWPFPAPREIPALLAEDLAIVRAGSFTLGGSGRAVPMLALVVVSSLGVLALTRVRLAPATVRRTALLLPALIALPCTAWLTDVLMHQRFIVALYYDQPEPVERLQVSSRGPFRGGAAPFTLAPGQSRKFRLPAPVDVQLVELVLGPAGSGGARACITAESTVEAAVAGQALSFPNAGLHQEIALPAKSVGSVSIASCGTENLDVYGLAVVPAS